MRSFQFLVQAVLCVVTSLVLGAGGCLTEPSATSDGGGVTEQFCSLDGDCPEFFECAGGICRKPCGNDDVCDFNAFCNGEGYCQAGCRDTPSCNDPNLLCVAGVCTDRNQVGTCATKADCVEPPNTRVCVDNQCVDPPAQCTGPQDCPGEGQCNGFTRECFNPNGDCMVAADCNGRTGCQASGCTCTMDRRCVPTPTCTLQDEAVTCGVGSFCDTTQQPMRCGASPACTRQTDCDAVRLACNSTTHVCERARDCTTPADCAGSVFTYCNTAQGFCQQANCINGGVMCSPPNDTCQTDGTCGPGAAITCTQHDQCPLGPPVQYCDAVNQRCRVGCRSDTNCNAGVGEKCNGNHVCEIPGGSSSGGVGGGDGDPCPNGDGDCRVGYGCAPLFAVCRELCVSPACPECPQTGYGCALAWCSPLITSTCP